MFEYLNEIASVLVILITIVLFLKLDLENIKDKIKSWNDVLDFLGKIPRLRQFYIDLNTNKQLLELSKTRLYGRMTDVKFKVEESEVRIGNQRSREVNNWLSTSDTKCEQVHNLLQEMERSDSNHFGKILQLVWLGYVVEKRIQEVDHLFCSGDFKEVLSPVREIMELLVRSLVGNAANRNINTILEWLNDGVTKVGVHGIEGVGKTELVKHVYNRLVASYDVYMITVPDNFREKDLQSEIAREVGIDLQEEDISRRAAVLHRALQRKNFVLIFDDVGKYFCERTVGIPLDPTKGKMIITSKSPVVCRRIGCHRNLIAIDPLPEGEALQLFTQEVQVDLSEFSQEDIANEIVRQCMGVPQKIIEKAIELRGIEDVSSWTVGENS